MKKITVFLLVLILGICIFSLGSAAAHFGNWIAESYKNDAGQETGVMYMINDERIEGSVDSIDYENVVGAMWIRVDSGSATIKIYQKGTNIPFSAEKETEYKITVATSAGTKEFDGVMHKEGVRIYLDDYEAFANYLRANTSATMTIKSVEKHPITFVFKNIDLNGFANAYTAMGGKKNGLTLDNDDVWRYYENNVFKKTTGVVEYLSNLFYIKDGVFYPLTGIVKEGGKLLYFKDGEFCKTVSGLIFTTDESGKNTNGYLLSGGIVQTGVTGLQPYGKQWFLVEKGIVNANYTGLYGDGTYGWWLVSGGEVNFDYTGLYGDAKYGWWLIGGGKVAFDYTGLWSDVSYGLWLIDGGGVAWGYNGVWNDKVLGSWQISNGAAIAQAGINANITGLHCDKDGVWRLYEKGTFCNGFTGIYYDETYGWWMLWNGVVDFDFDGLFCDSTYGWWLIRGGTVAFGYNGFWQDEAYGDWLVLNGTVAFGYTDYYEDPVIGTYYVQNGEVLAGGNG